MSITRNLILSDTNVRKIGQTGSKRADHPFTTNAKFSKKHVKVVK